MKLIQYSSILLLGVGVRGETCLGGEWKFYPYVDELSYIGHMFSEQPNKIDEVHKYLSLENNPCITKPQGSDYNIQDEQGIQQQPSSPPQTCFPANKGEEFEDYKNKLEEIKKDLERNPGLLKSIVQYLLYGCPGTEESGTKLNDQGIF